ncbi:hypothetical protein C8255_26755 [filamentous cyanobacterium CCP3]|nr:hypothetical protein C8255_26755 [filamentous cyanobacterium CCP3]
MIKIKLTADVFHLITATPEGQPDLDAYTSSFNTRAALQAAYDAGNWEPYEPPQAELGQMPPDWSAFRMALLQSESFRTWSEVLPATWREDLKMAALAANAEALQTVYDICESISEPSPEAAAEWQQIAQENAIPVMFDG